MKVSNFETFIEPHILNRGYDYYFQNQVIELSRENDIYEAIVQGSTEYDVEITIQNDQIVKHECNCPFEGSICKHVVAVLYKIRENQNKQNIVDAKKQVIQYLNTLDKQDILTWLNEKLSQSNEIAQSWALSIPRVNTPDEVIKIATELVKIDLIRLERIKHQNEYDIGYIELDFATEHLIDIFDQASQQQDPKLSLKLYLLLLAPVFEYQEYIALSDVLYTLKDDVFDGIRTLVESEYDIQTRRVLLNTFDGFFQAYNSDDTVVEDIITMLHFTLEIIKTEQEIAQFKLWLSMFKPRGVEQSKSYFHDAFIKLEKHLIEKTQSKEQYLAYLHEHIFIKDFRDELIHYYIKKLDYNKAIQLTKSGLTDDPTYSALWSDRLYQLYELTNQKDAAKSVAFECMVKGYHQYIDHYQGYFDKQSWDHELTRLIDYAVQMKHDHLYASLVRKYHRNQDVIAYIYKNPSCLNQYIEYIKPEQIEQFESLVKTHILDILNAATNRKDYRHLRSRIEFYRSLYGDARTDAIIQDIIQSNPKKKALIDELSTIRKRSS